MHIKSVGNRVLVATSERGQKLLEKPDGSSDKSKEAGIGLLAVLCYLNCWLAWIAFHDLERIEHMLESELFMWSYALILTAGQFLMFDSYGRLQKKWHSRRLQALKSVGAIVEVHSLVLELWSSEIKRRRLNLTEAEAAQEIALRGAFFDSLWQLAVDLNHPLNSKKTRRLILRRLQQEITTQVSVIQRARNEVRQLHNDQMATRHLLAV